MVAIIQAKSEHLSQIYAIILELAKYENILDKIKITESQLGKLLFCNEPNHFIGVALVEEKICGLVMFNYTQNNICVNVTQGIYIENLYVSPPYRRQGIGCALFKYVACKAAAHNCSRIEWWVSRNNREARHFYKKIGGVALLDWQIFKCDQIGINNLMSIGVANEHILFE
ncbi:GNAT family N-acetyltransferase [Legionella pneumophila serogroup 1]|nr:GNAT family N-acetyltransferase [Legionella pneumophila]HAT8862466.1 GNAT family N-acetyltransferase [Legionella pneumophila subsp. pneumophila]MCO1452166.1 GNAT family N-acetyltransferase [Legionella pneumophila]MCZ4692288.1 GNAT family N-acetyltransferase [Legionella pneumophila]MCZ4711530.1 GNAT family N-acetyltransferase [Legionella pneumophila]MCZ4721598.1 GNAT family N-acetyltransferase [Legionella pneumophila]